MNRTRVRGVIEHSGKFLLVRNKSSQDFWCLPGGGVDPGEDIISALKRELIEETGIDAIVGELLYVHQIKSSEGYGVPEFIFYIENGKDFLELNLATTTHGELELAEIGFKDLADPTLIVRPNFLKSELPELAKSTFDTKTKIHLSD